ncbi:virulence RhuM family protein [Geobacter benzoatilyticus]|uniref:Virulence RhuM family protein n=1 Tax=Geobacter benzoatilyticus TaxID=2815309 RepID=A0ABX7Q639_9BACT|nr:virulence RhuM family protein [Geobacter benzoatilyticus]QSV46912.1 virulence RhuM family protein [Geobacter benzoatilyticus]
MTQQQAGEILFYQTEDGRIRLECRFEDESLWLTQAAMAELYQVTPQNVTLHLRAIYEEGELEQAATCKDYLQVQSEGGREVSRTRKFYNLDAILAVGYRVRSHRGTQFRRWATDRLKEYLVKGFTMDDERLKNPPVAGSTVPDYFDEMLARIRDIRASERRMYLRVKEIFAMAGDYDPSWAETTKFFSVIQNKLHFAATGMTAAQLILKRADHTKPNMGLTNWKAGEVRKTDVTIAKNYLKEEEIAQLNRIVVMWLDYAEDQAERRKQVFMKDWEQKLDEFLRFNERNVLPNAGTVSKKRAEGHAREEYEQFAVRRREYKEALGEEESLKALEEAARLVGREKKKVEGGE